MPRHDDTDRFLPGRDKDVDDVRVLLKKMMMEPETLLQRIAALDPARASIDVVSAGARRRAQEAAAA